MPVFYHLDIVAHSLHFRQDMRGKQNGMINSNLLDQLANLKNLIRVQPVRRLVQHHEFRTMYDGLRYSQTLLIPAGKITDQPLAEMSDTAPFLGHLYSLLDFLGFHQSQFRTKFKIFINRVVRIQGWFLR